MIVQVDTKTLPFTRIIQGLCRTPYHGHPKGCPNFGKKEVCPPQPLIDKVLDFNKDVFAIYTEYMIGVFAEKIRKKHPDWSLRQIYNPRYWQGPARKIHRGEQEKARQQGIEKIVWPEAHGVNVTGLMWQIGIELKWQWPPEHNLENKSYIISLGGFPKD